MGSYFCTPPYDALYVPRRSYTTGDVDVHDVHLDNNGRLVFVNTLYSCLVTVSERYSFQPLWQPPFISKLAPEDRCHLNGLALADGEPRYVTAISRSDVFGGWRKRREKGGVLIDIQTDEILLENLSMPHSPRLYLDKLWLLNAGSGDLGYVDWEAGRFEPVAFCPGFARGLAFHKDYAIVGISKPRRVKAFEGLSLDDRLAAKDADAYCGLSVIDLTTGNVAHWVEVEGLVSELYDVAVLENVRRPMALGFKSDEISRFVTIDYPDAPPDFQQLKASPETSSAPIDFFSMRAVGTSHQPSAVSHQSPTLRRGDQGKSSISDQPYRFQLSFDMSVATILQHYHSFTFPPLHEQLRGRPFREPLVAAVALSGDTVVGLALAEQRSDTQGAVLRSCFVAAPHRRRGVATQLLAYLADGLKRAGLDYLDLVYSTDWPSAPVVEHILNKYGWQPPQTTLYQYKASEAEGSKMPWLYDQRARLPEGYETFPWADLTLEEISAIQQKGAQGWYPSNLDPFQAAEYRAFNSLGLCYEGIVCGWMVTHQPAPDAIQYTSFFVAPEHWEKRLGLPMLAAALHIHVASDIPYAIWQVAADNTGMLAFVRRYIQPYLMKQTERRISRKILGIIGR